MFLENFIVVSFKDISNISQIFKQLELWLDKNFFDVIMIFQILKNALLLN